MHDNILNLMKGTHLEAELFLLLSAISETVNNAGQLLVYMFNLMSRVATIKLTILF